MAWAVKRSPDRSPDLLPWVLPLLDFAALRLGLCWEGRGLQLLPSFLLKYKYLYSLTWVNLFAFLSIPKSPLVLWSDVFRASAVYTVDPADRSGSITPEVNVTAITNMP